MARRVLIVDHDVECRQALGAILEMLGHVCLAAEHGWGALGILEKVACDLVVIDLLNPHMEGIEALMRLRARHPGLSVVAMTGGWRALPADDMLRLARALGADATLRKPFDRAAIEAALAQTSCTELENPEGISICGSSKPGADRSIGMGSALPLGFSRATFAGV